MALKSLSLAVLGQSTVGKTTYIASLCEDSVQTFLYERAKNNEKGQTKVICYYRFAGEATGISQVVIYGESILKDDQDAKIKEITDLPKDLMQSLKLTHDTLCNYAEEAFLISIPVSLDIQKLKDLDTEENAKIIHHIVIDVCASEAFDRYLSRNDIHELIIRDVRGFSDVKNEDMERIKNSAKGRADYFGYENADGIILFCPKLGVSSGDNGKIYDQVIEEATALKPLIIISRSQFLRTHMLSGEKYEDVMNDKTADVWDVDDFKNIQKSVQAIIAKNNVSAYSKIISSYIQYAFVVEFSTDNATHRPLYRDSVIGSINYAVSNLQEFKSVVKAATGECGQTVISNLGKYIQDNMYISERFSKCLLQKSWWGMVGSNGGLTTYITGEGRVGQTVINMMDDVYWRVRSFLSTRWQREAVENQSISVQQAQILAYSIVDRLLYSVKFRDWRSTLNPTASEEHIVKSAFYATCKQMAENSNLETEDILGIYKNQVAERVMSIAQELMYLI